MDAPGPNSWDLFISHASEDKKDLVQPLAEALSRFGLKVWYDDYTLEVGDSLSRSIDKGLANSKYGLIVLSQSFIAKRWPEYELRGLTARELTGGKVIIPIWHNISHEDVLRFSPPLADKFAISTSELTAVQVAFKILKAIRPDIFSAIARRIAFKKVVQTGERVFKAPEELRPAAFRYSELPADLIGRIRLIRAALFEIFPQSLDDWINQFRRDLYPSDEISIWERVAAVLLECCLAFPQLTAEQKNQVFSLICCHWSNRQEDIVAESLQILPDGATEMIIRSYQSSTPLYSVQSDDASGVNVETK